MRTKLPFDPASAVAALWACAAAFGACGGETPGLPPGPVALSVTVTAGDVGSRESPMPFSLEGTSYTVDINAVGGTGMGDGWVAIRSQPGDVVSVVATGSIRDNVPVTGGRASGVEVVIAKAYGDTRIWAEDIGFVPGPVLGSQCGNALDDDGDGRIDYGDDPGCAFSNDDSEVEGSHAVGVTGPLWFANPNIADVQGFASESPLSGRSITIEGGTMVVTRVSVDGLYVTDVAETRGGASASLFAYNFNTPGRVRICDRLVAIGGIVGEFYGYTELGFPSWTLDPAIERPDPLPTGPGECLVPEPAELTAGTLDDARAMEALESGLVQVTGGTITARFPDCDTVNPNGVIDFGTDEETCADLCDGQIDCTEYSQYRRYGQFGIALAGATPADPHKVLVVTREVYPDFEATGHAGETVGLVRGTLRQVSFLNTPWILEIRCRDDFVPSGEARPMWQACVPPLDDDEGYSR